MTSHPFIQRETDRERQTHRDRETDREKDRDRQRQRQRHTQRQRETDRDRETDRKRQTETKADIHRQRERLEPRRDTPAPSKDIGLYMYTSEYWNEKFTQG